MLNPAGYAGGGALKNNLSLPGSFIWNRVRPTRFVWVH